MPSEWDPEDEPVVGVVEGGPADEDTPTTDSNADDPTESFDRVLASDAFEAATADADVVRGSLEEVLAANPTLLVAQGTATLSAVSQFRPSVPVLPVGSVPGIDAVPPDHLADHLERTLAGAARLRHHDVLAIDVDWPEGSDTTGADSLDLEHALFDVTLVTAEPARISEYAVSRDGEQLETVRADGIVVATPAGSHGYAEAVDAPRLSPAVEGVAVAPIGPFVTKTRQWVLPTDLACSVERDEGDVRLVVDGRSVGTVSVGTEVAISKAGTLAVLAPSTTRIADRSERGG
ncbi:NAD(+)/NADH kinase [Halopiger goleimassiliensis]|uniref:NAD(+)/NADH kinase n=1 Tax=Halopiger goleimassiliensis TaxID=1293048 RepID=UPI000677DC54|nr:NAD(+)/NADH kinase [Halopiger goleimassiliensis]